MFKRFSFFQKNLLLSAIFTFLVGIILIAASYYFEGKVITETLSQQGKGLGNLIANSFDPDLVKKAETELDVNAESQKELVAQLDKISKYNTNVAQGYLFEGKLNENNMFKSITNPSSLIEVGAVPGAEMEPFPSYVAAVERANATKEPATTEIYDDQFGTWFTVITPVLDSSGNVVAMFAVDMSATIIRESQLSMVMRLAAALVVLFLIILAVQFFFLKRMLNPIKDLSNAVDEVGAGNLNVELDVKSQDEIGVVAAGFNEMVKKIRNMMKEIESATGQLVTTFTQVAAVSDNSKGQAEHVLRSLQEISTTTEYLASEAERGNSQLWDINAKIGEILEHTSEAHSSIAKCVDESAQGIDIVEGLKQKSSQTEAITLGLGQKIYSLEERTRRINSLLSSIQDVAEQTGLLSLNASIEAARAGEHGRGFSVVADEIRKLSANTKQASQEIDELLSDISRDIVSTGQEMRIAEDSLREQTNQVEDTIQSFYHIRNNVQAVASSVQKVTQTIQVVEQSKESLLSTVESVSSMSEQTAASVELIQQNFTEQLKSIYSLNDSNQALQEQANRLASQLIRTEDEAEGSENETPQNQG
ncbi:methyl-accepting chemotaxis protein [Tumebacillus sp. BK434]|uniref:methyl-accepting chemotaxis protein n=1 Tax=Tumebacillus sp. BK434 TaxID=2512169 RepID=UPI0010D667C4|nr:methyl-accepting chemotaxis protein [Tumebacillus sp. BK434]TCP59596.1 methyl-accepting chemotaxis protein [Tumebacillus sp. BK434]